MSLPLKRLNLSPARELFNGAKNISRPGRELEPGREDGAEAVNPIWLLALSLVIAVPAISFVVELVNRRPALGALALFGWLGVSILFSDYGEYFTRSIGGVNVSVPDLLAALLGGIGGLRILQHRTLIQKELKWCLVIFVGLLLLSYLRGVRDFGVQHATNEFREFFYFLCALAFGLSFPRAQLADKLPRWAVIGGAWIVVVALLRLPKMGGFNLEERVVPSFAALVIGQAFFLGWFWERAKQPGWLRWWIFGFLPFSFLMLHRSVWMALLGGLLALLMLDRVGRGRLVRTLAIGSALAVAAVMLTFREAVATGLDRAVGEATSSEESTFLWRLEGWTALLHSDEAASRLNLIAGKPMGSGYARVLGDSAVNAPEIESGVIPHNYYLSLFLRGGLVGLAAFLALYYALFRGLRRSVESSGEPGLATCFAVVLATQLVYYVPYSADAIQGLFLGGAIAVASSARNS